MSALIISTIKGNVLDNHQSLLYLLRMSQKNNPVWKNPPYHPPLNCDRVHLWRANLNLPSAVVEQLASFLSKDEVARANKFRFPQHQRRFTVARGILRHLLANYLQISPVAVQFEYGDRGKPSLAIPFSDSSLQFNISHSQEYALYGFTYNYPLGVDLEYLRSMEDVAKIAQRFFSTQEYQLIASLSGQQQQKAFFQLWTAKEAYLKATGIGLTGSLADVNICLDQTDPCLQAIQGNKQATANWSMYSYLPVVNYVAAIAIKTKTNQQQIDCWNWHCSLCLTIA